ncbi:MAG: hypothetical protein WA063_06340 [Minisyncoccia bacterium]
MSSLVGKGEIVRIEKPDKFDTSGVKPKFESKVLEKKEKVRISKR